MDISPVQALLEECSSLEEFRDRLVDLYADLDVTSLADVMREAFTVAELAGRFDASERQICPAAVQRSDSAFSGQDTIAHGNVARFVGRDAQPRFRCGGCNTGRCAE
eukprot:TRINITY_DN48525_c0_g1_i1.p2 TRINITY_DN48525_c0_g1~~TRINITY_DN48525_c0_g1_i1.p2  ORF type:complete len:120 (+),score=12.85 TRINITY_DN48525_c0_g1_i1:42-362(+)